MGAAIPFAPLISAVGQLGGLFMGGASAPQVQAAPPPPQVQAAPQAPQVAQAKDVTGGDQVVDQDAARIRAQQRRASANNTRLFSLSTDDEALTLTRSLLGD